MASLTTTFTTSGTAAFVGSMGGVQTWGTTANALATDNNYAVYSVNQARPWADNSYTFYLKVTELASKVPAGATIDGVTISIERRAGAGATWKDKAVYLVKGGVIQTTQNKATATAYTASDVTENHGGAADLWGIALTAADVNASDFGCVFSCFITGDDGEGGSVPNVDLIGVTINYTEAATSNPSNLLLRGVS